MTSNISKFILVLAIAFNACRGAHAAVPADNLNGVLAIVNNYVITVHEVRAGMMQLGQSTSMNTQELMAEVLKILIEDKLILTDFENSGFAIPDSYFDDAFESMISESYEDRLQFIQTLKARGQHLEEVRKEFKERRIIQIMSSQKIGQQIAISPYKIERYYNEHQDDYRLKDRVNLRMIIIPSKGTSDVEASAKAEMIHQKLLDGTEFAELARQYSTGVQAREGGLMGWQDREEMRKEIAEVAFEMEVGETSNIISTSNAIFIVRVEEKEAAHVQPLAEVREQIEAALRSEETAERRKKWIAELRKKSFVRTF